MIQRNEIESNDGPMGGQETINFTQAALYAFDAVWSIALGLDHTLEKLSHECESETFIPLDGNTAAGHSKCIGDLLRTSIDKVSFEGASVSKILAK